jgi:hypothetical protein
MENNINNILTDIYNSKDLNNLLEKLPQHLREDAKQHLFLEMLEKGEEKLLELINKGTLKFYMVKVLYNMTKMSKTNSFARSLGILESPTDFSAPEWEELTPEEETEADKYIIDDKLDLSSLSWYEENLILLSIDHQSYRKVSKITGIPTTSICNAIRGAKMSIMKNYNNKWNNI